MRRRTHQVLENVAKFRHVPLVVLPYLAKRLEEDCALVALLRDVLLAPGRECGDDVLAREPVEVLDHELVHAFVEHLAFLRKHDVVREPVVLLERELERVVVVDLADVSREL